MGAFSIWHMFVLLILLGPFAFVLPGLMSVFA